MRHEDLESLALATAEAQSLTTVLGGIVRGLAREPDVALARLWLVDDGDICDGCPARGECPGRVRCLQLAASAGASRDGKESWERLDGDFRRIPIGARKVGLVSSTGRMILVGDGAPKDPLIARPAWAKREGIRSFCGQPLVFRGQVLGVLAVFCRQPIDESAARGLRALADHAAVAITNARAFDELSRLKDALERERDALVVEASGVVAGGPILGRSEGIRRVLQQIDLVAPTDANVLVLGESGTGKELVATAVHERSRRRDQALVRVNCAAVPSELFESEFFGHARGAFTGALRERTGKLQLADRGTLFLDEIAEIPLSLQGKLLRALQEKQFERVGEDRTRTVDVRIVAATNRDLAAEVEAGRFREDLFFRLSVFPLRLPPLRERSEDIAVLVPAFLDAVCARLGRPRLAASAKDLARLARHAWPGNVRELMNVVERAVILADRNRPRFDLALDEPELAGSGAAPAKGGERGFLTEAEWRARERANLEAALRAAGGRVWGERGAAALLGVRPTTLASRLRAHGLRASSSEPRRPTRARRG